MPELLPNVRLQLANAPENVALVREMLSGLAEALGVDGTDLNDIRTAVTEACNNIVLHAYRGGPGPMEVDVHVASQSLKIFVRDHGRGIRAREEEDPTRDEEEIDADDCSAGIGLHVIRTLAHDAEFQAVEGGGTEVCMEFVLLGVSALEPCPDKQALNSFASSQPSSAAILSISPIGLARTVLPRLVSALAARAHFSTDRISDAQLLADALVAHADGALSGDLLGVCVNVEPREIELHIAPLMAGRARRLIGDSELDGMGRVIEKLTNRLRVTKVGAHETLTLGLVDSR
jgi:serine/threonine-protein kinase RsbW